MDTLNRPMIKADARAKLKGCWPMLFVACLLPSLTVALTGMRGTVTFTEQWTPSNMPSLAPKMLLAYLLSIVVDIFVIVPMRVSLSGILLDTARRGERPRILRVFSCFGPGYLNVVKGILPMQLRMEGWGLIAAVAPLLLPNTLGPLLGVAAWVWMINRSIAYMYTPYIVSDNPGISGDEALGRSIGITRRRLIELFVALQLSFIPWILLVGVTFGIALVYVLPYMMMTECLYYVAMAGRAQEVTGEVV